MTVDVDNLTATVSPSTRGGQEFAPFLGQHGLVFPGGHCSTVGLGGYLLQGGQGWNSRQWGWGCENVLGVDVVTADGDLVRADAETNSDLYWAARGQGRGSSASSLDSTCACTACRSRSRTPPTRSPSTSTN